MLNEPSILSAALSGVVAPNFELVQASRTEKQSFLAAYIAHRLKELGYGVKDVAEAAGVTRQFLYGVIRGDMLVPDTLLLKLSNATTITFAELIMAHAVDLLLTERADA